MGLENSRQSQTRDRCRILGLQESHFGGYNMLEVTKRSKLGNSIFTIKLRSDSESRYPNNLGMNRKNKWVPWSKCFYKLTKIAQSGIWVFMDFRLLIGQPCDGWGHAGIIVNPIREYVV